MRSVFRSVLVALVAVVALGAVSVASASAHEFYIEGKSMTELGLKEEAISGEGTKGTSTQLLSAAGIKVTCNSSAVSGTIKAGGEGTARFTLTECSVETPSNCIVEEPVVFQTNSGLVETEGKLADSFMLPGSPPQVLLNFLGANCNIAGKWYGEGNVTGLVASEVENTTGELKFTAVSGSDLVMGGSATTFKTRTSVKLSGANAGRKWSAKK